MRLTRIFSGLHTQTPQLAWVSNWVIPILVCPANCLERQLCAKGIGQMLGPTGAHTTVGGGEPWQDHVLA